MQIYAAQRALGCMGFGSAAAPAKKRRTSFGSNRMRACPRYLNSPQLLIFFKSDRSQRFDSPALARRCKCRSVERTVFTPLTSSRCLSGARKTTHDPKQIRTRLSRPRRRRACAQFFRHVRALGKRARTHHSLLSPILFNIFIAPILPAARKRELIHSIMVGFIPAYRGHFHRM